MSEENINTRVPKDWNEHKSTPDLQEMMQTSQLEISFEEKLDIRGSEDKYSLLVKSTKVSGFRRCYSLKNMRSLASDLLSYGHKVNENEVTKILNMLTDDIEKYTSTRFHTGIGWFHNHHELMFMYNSVATATKDLAAEYRGKLDLKQQGNLKDYIEGIQKLVVPYPKLFTVFVAGASGIVTQALQYPDTNILVNICGTSGCGKTTAGNTALSFWEKASAVGFNTLNRTEELLSQRFIMPTPLDDMMSACSSSNERVRQKEILDMIFRLSTGKVKGRMRQSDSKFYGAILASSETSIINKTLNSDTSGQLFRMIELKVKKGELTKDAEHAKKLDKLNKMHYGLGAFKLGRYMLQNGYTGGKLEDLYYNQYSSLMMDKRLAKHQRAINRIAILMVSATLLNKCFKLGASTDVVKETLIDAVVQSTKLIDVRLEAYKKLNKLIKQNQKAFSGDQATFRHGKHLGVFHKNVYGYEELIIPTSYMEPFLNNIPVNQILNDSGNYKVKQPQDYELRNILNHWKKYNWLKCGGRGDQLYLKRKLGDSKKQSLVYIVTLGLEDEGEV